MPSGHLRAPLRPTPARGSTSTELLREIVVQLERITNRLQTIAAALDDNRPFAEWEIAERLGLPHQRGEPRCPSTEPPKKT